MQDVIPLTWRLSAAHTDAKLYDVTSTQRAAIVFVLVDASNSNTGDVSCTVGLGTTTLPTLTADSLTGIAGIAFSHPGIAKGGGAVRHVGGHNLALGALDEDLRITHSAATGGFIDVIVGLRIVE